MPVSRSIPLPLGLLLVVSAALTGCSTVTEATRKAASSIVPYKIEIVQGNFVSKEQVEALKPGMTRQQVREVLGTPLLQSVFHADRWDYVFTMKRQGLDVQARQLTVYFKADVMERAEGDPMPSESEFVALLGSAKQSKSVPVLEASEDSLKPFAPPPAATAATPASPAATAPLPTSYPPLEIPLR
ncbi:outer membrane protein assembly factor BamE [Pseudorhodoferax sp. Leaf267]|uniref:outer membrane protein assembly factor BamE n=1 Tax=Pseudorhodoferax sp. Leaf267 TaxID=1736316 RepID=UPI0006FB5152|nr:outer membrane protein assembly factor BamE [Pseudorhodoferax sp. Leaf267]KQP12167.1 cell envelope protein SmpA [Pseudorhodoferax sp. Leaf267]